MALSISKTPLRGEIWTLDLNPTRGHEQAGDRRPYLIISADLLNSGPAEIVFAVPLTTTDREIRLHVRVQPPDVARPSVILCDQLRAVSKERLKARVGAIRPATLREVEDRLGIIMDL